MNSGGDAKFNKAKLYTYNKSKREVHSVVPSLCQQKSYNMHVDDWILLRNTHTVTTHAKKQIRKNNRLELNKGVISFF
jgi:hypothetical protein